MASDILERRELRRMALKAGSSWDPESRQVVIVAATSAPQADGIALRMNGMRMPAQQLPVFVNHDADPRQFVGSVVALEIGREKGLDALIATVQLANSEAGRAVEPMVASGVARWSVRARIDAVEAGPRGTDYSVATDWLPLELSIVGIGMDPAAVTRSHNSTTENNTMTTTTEPKAPTPAEIRRAAELSRQLDAIVRFAPEAARDEVHRIAETAGLDAARAAAIDAKAADEERTPTRTHIQAPQQADAVGSIERTVAGVIERGERPQGPTWLQLRDAGFPGSNPVDVWRSALQGRRSGWLQRAAHSTSDLPALLLASGDRMLQAQFTAANNGILAAARIRQLNDYRPASIIDAGKTGKAQKLLEGGELKFSPIEESVQSYRPFRWGDGASVTPESLSNDDLDALRQVFAELGLAALDAEREELVALLEGAALGAPAADGKALFHADHNNKVDAGPLSISKLGEAVALLRAQKTVGGRHVDQAPGAIICGVAAELPLRQLVSSLVTPTEAQHVNPWRDLAVEVDPRLGDDFAYLVSSGPRMPLELGRLTPAPQMTDEVNFDTGAYRIKAEHSFGVAVAEHRAIVRMRLGES